MSILNLMIFDLYADVSKFSVKVAHCFIESFFRCFFFLRRLRLYLLSSEESESSLEDGSDKSSFQCLRQFFLLLCFFFFDIEYDEDVFDDRSDDCGYGSGFTSGFCLSSFFELSVDRVSGLSFNVIT